MSLLRRIEKSLDQRLRAIFGGSRDQPGAREAIELYRDALDQIGERATAGKRGDRIFPFDLLRVELRPGPPERKAALEALFEAGQMVEDVRATLTEQRVSLPAKVSIVVQYPSDAAAELRIFYEKNDPVEAETLSSAAMPFLPAQLTTLTGVANLTEFHLDQPRANIGREREVVDSLGRTLRRNDLYFTEGSHEANATVSRSHAHLRFQPASGEWRIYDDGSTLGTSIFRAGQRIEIPAHSARGVVLRSGDEIYLGQVRLSFQR